MLHIRRDERWPLAVATLIFAILNAVNVCRYWYTFCSPADNYRKLFVGKWQISGFDPLTYVVISDWDTAYNVYRHPLLAFMMYPFYLINKLLMWMTGINWATTITALILTTCGSLSFLLLYRILHHQIGASRRQTLLLEALFFSMAFIMLAVMVPDHFVISMCALIATIYICGQKLHRGSALNWWQTVLMFVLTAGVSLNNGLKVFLAALVTRRRRFFSWRYLLIAVLLPSALMWATARMEYRHFVWPKEMARKEAKKRNNDRLVADIYKTYRDTARITDSASVEAGVRKIIQDRARAKKKRDSKKIWNRNTGKPINSKDEFLRWTDISTSRIDAAVENLFGEGIQLHDQHLLGDVLRNRPVIVRYNYAINYIVEAIIVLLFVAGLWCGRRSRLLWTAVSFFLLDMALHMGLGFGINEIYIMSPHYLFVLPIAMAFIFTKTTSPRKASYLETLILCLALWCAAWNGQLLIQRLIM